MDHSQVLLNERVDRITDRLKFLVTDSPSVIEAALYSQPSIGGMNVILPNDDETDTELNLESLFEMSMARPDVLKDLFNSNTTKL